MFSAKRWAKTDALFPEKLGIALVRIMVGAVFVMHGYQKWFVWKPAGTVAGFQGMGFPPTAAYAAMTAELLCGTLLVLGLFTRLAAIPIVATMAVAIIEVHLPNGFFLVDKSHGYEYALTLGVAALGLLLAGPGTLSVDSLLSRK